MTGKIAVIRTCATCAHWSPYLPGVGECLEYAKRRQKAHLMAEDFGAFLRDWPHRPAPDTEATHVCDRHEAVQR